MTAVDIFTQICKILCKKSYCLRLQWPSKYQRFVLKRKYIRRVPNTIAVYQWWGERIVDWPVSTEGAYQVRVDVAKSCSK